MGKGTQTAVSERRTVAEEVYRGLKRDIITLKHRPGASLPEQELAGLYGSSRVPVREACSRLQKEGLLTNLPYKGYFVSQVSLKDITDHFDLRLILETHSLEMAAEHATGQDLQQLEELACTEYTFHDWESYACFLDNNRDFHLKLAALGRNERLVAVLRDLLDSMQRFFFLGLEVGDFGTVMRSEHEQLVTLLKRDAVAAAVACLRNQIELSRARILRALADKRIDIPLE